MLTKINTQKLMNLMPEKVPVYNLKEILYKLERMEDKKRKMGTEIDWEYLQKEIGYWEAN